MSISAYFQLGLHISLFSQYNIIFMDSKRTGSRGMHTYDNVVEMQVKFSLKLIPHISLGKGEEI
jgi:hypothetical protein